MRRSRVIVTNGRTEDELSKTHPNEPGARWIVSGQETSQLDPRHLAALEDDVLAELGLERGTVTVQ